MEISVSVGAHSSMRGVLFANAQFADLFLTQHQADVVVERITQGKTHQSAQRLVTESDGQKLMKTLPIQFADVDTKLAAAVAHPLPQYHALPADGSDGLILHNQLNIARSGGSQAGTAARYNVQA